MTVLGAGVPDIFQAVLNSEHGGVRARNGPAAETGGPDVLTVTGLGGEYAPALHHKHAPVIHDGHAG